MGAEDSIMRASTKWHDPESDTLIPLEDHLTDPAPNAKPARWAEIGTKLCTLVRHFPIALLLVPAVTMLWMCSEYPCRLTASEYQGLKTMSQDFAAALDGRNISWVLCEGSLIGALRDGCIIRD